MTIENVALHFCKIAKNQPDQIAIEEGANQITYGRLQNRAIGLRDALTHFTAEPKSLIGVCMEPGANLVSSIISIFLSEGIYLPIDLKFSQARLMHIFEKSCPEILLVDNQNYAAAKELVLENSLPVHAIIVIDDLQVVKVEKLENKQFAEIALKPKTNEGRINDESYLFYTSGSTGTPKAVLGSIRSLSHFINWEIDQLSFDNHLKVSWLTQFTFDASLRDIFIPLCAGGTLAVPPNDTRQNTIKLIEWLNDSEISVIHTVPSVFRLILQLLESHKTPDQFQKLKYILLAGELLYAKDVLKWNEFGNKNTAIINLYGATETTLVRTFHIIKNLPENSAQGIHVGQPIHDTMILILNTKNQLCKIGEVGQVYIKTKYPTHGYYKDRERTDAVFVRNPLIPDRYDVIYKTGDLGRYLKDRNIEILGRSDSQIKIRGVRVDCIEVENAVRMLSGIKEAVVQGVKNSSLETELVAYFTGENVQEEVLRTQLKASLNKEYIPDYFIRLPEFPLNVNGKIDKRALPKPERLVTEINDSDKPQGEIEERLSLLWKEILNMKMIGRNTSFFSVGGHSLRAIELVTRIADEFSVAFKIVEIFELKTIKEQAAFIAQKSGNHTQDAIPKLEEKQAYELSYVQKQLWLLDQMMKGTAALNIHWGTKIKGALEIEHFNTSVERIFNHYEILRTTFNVVDNQPMQVIHDDWTKTCNVDFVDISNQKDIDNQIAQLSLEESERVINIEEGPLTFVKLVKLQEGEFALFFTMHHLISDATSVKIIIKEFLNTYQHLLIKTTYQLPVVDIQYKDFASWLNRKIDSEEVDSLKEFWKEYLPQKIKTPDLPYDRMPKAVKTFNGSKYHLKLEKEVSIRIKEWTSKESVSYFIFLTAIINLHLYLSSGQKDIVTGTPSTLRRRKDLENQIGYFIDALLIRTTLNLNDSFRDFQQQVKNQVLTAFDHGEYPYQKIKEKIYPKSEVSDALFNVSIAVIDGQIDSFDDLSGDLQMEPLATPEQSSKFDITIISAESTDNQEVVFEYNSDLFDHSTIELFATDFHQLLKATLEKPDELLRDFQLDSDNSEVSDNMFESFTGGH